MERRKLSKDHKHNWIYDGRSCCYRLKCSTCKRSTRAYHLDGSMPNIGDPVSLNEDTETIRVIGSGMEEE